MKTQATIFLLPVSGNSCPPWSAGVSPACGLEARAPGGTNLRAAVLRTCTLFLLALLFCIQPVTATGPRVSANLFEPHANQIYAMDLPPFIDSGQAGGGLNAEIVKAAMAAGQVEFVFTALPLQTMLKYYLLEENALAVLGRDLSLNAEEQAGLIFVPLFIAEESYWYHARPLPWNGKLESLAGRTYGAFKGEDVSAYQAAGIDIKYGRGKGLMEKLVAGKLDFIRLPALSIDWLVNRHYLRERQNIVKLEPDIGEAPLFIIFNKKHPAGEAIAAKFRQGLADIIANGRYGEILHKHMAGEAANARVKRLEYYLEQP